jgi:integrase
MPGKQAKILSVRQIEDLLFFAKTTRNPIRNSVIVLFSVKAGLRAAEIANLTWEMIIDPNGEVASHMELRDHAAKKGSGRIISLNAALHAAFIELRFSGARSGPVVRSERGGKMSALSIVVWFRRAYKTLGLEGCSSHSGRRTSSLARPGWFIRPAAPCAMSSDWQVIGQSKPRSGTSTVIPKRRGGWYR